MKKSFSYLLTFALFLALLPSALVFAQGEKGHVSANPGAEPPPPAARAVGRGLSPGAARVEQDISEALSVIQQNYVGGRNLDYNAVFKSSITGMLHTLDPHSSYFDQHDFEEFLTEQRSEYYGIGATIGDLRLSGEVNTYIRATFDGSPANRAGLRYGDRIIAVDGQSMKNKPFFEVREHLLGPQGTQVKVTVEHLNGQTETVEITRAAVPQPSVPEAYMIRPGVGYVAMTGGFNTTTSDEMRAALESLHSQGMKMLVLDLRNNRGGLLIQSVRIANMFLQRGQVILTQKGRIRGSSQSFTAINDSPDQTPLVVLVNRGSASASEILAGALQDHDRALIVGETSFGKGLVQNPFQLEYGSALLLTVAKYYTPSGRLIQRDYTNESFYDYYTQGGSLHSEASNGTQRPAGTESHTDTGRVVYGGGGITPDEAVKPNAPTTAQNRLVDPIFAFAMELVRGRVAGLESYKVQQPIDFEHELQPGDLPMTDAVYKALRDFVIAKQSVFKVSPALLDRERAFVERQLRYEVVTAAYGFTTSLRVYHQDDPQINKAVEVLPRARELSQSAWRARNPS